VLVYNHEKYIIDCLNSIAAQNLDFPYEVLIGEDCSTDSSRALLEDFARRNPGLNFKYIFREKNIGGTANMLDLYYAAAAEYVVHLDGDDLTYPDKLQRQVVYLDTHPQASVCGHFMDVMDFDGKLRNLRFPQHAFESLGVRELVLYGMPCANSSLMFRKSALPRLDPSLPHLDWYILFELLNSGRLGFVDAPLGIYRFNPASAVSVLGSAGLKELMLEMHRRAYAEHPELRAELACVGLLDVLVDLVHRRRPRAPQLRFLWHLLVPAAIPLMYSTYQVRKSIAKALVRW
jgi:glycosyltransferase involved in cell wall biosynthesis